MPRGNLRRLSDDYPDVERERMWELLSADVDGETSRLEHAAVTAHLRHCADCRHDRADLEALKAQSNALAERLAARSDEGTRR